MKVECSVCGNVGILEQRGNSQRVLHYKGIFSGKRLYEKHTLGVNGNNSMVKMGINGNKPLGTNKAETSVFKDNRLAIGTISREDFSLEG
jgi:hypothetical protein